MEIRPLEGGDVVLELKEREVEVLKSILLDWLNAYNPDSKCDIEEKHALAMSLNL